MTKPSSVSADPACPQPVKQPRKKPVRITPAQREEGEEGQINKHWRTYFLQKLAETSNVTASAAHVGIAPSRAYKVRREDRGFDRAWREALYEGYQHLEMEVLGFLRGTDPDRKLDVANAIRVLKAHSETIAQERALQDNLDEAEVRESIDAMIDQMRNRSIANAALLAEPEERTNEDG
jgi:hypothetical protein